MQSQSPDQITRITEQAKKLNLRGQEADDNIIRSRSITLSNLRQELDKLDYTIHDKIPKTLPRPKPTPAARQNAPVILEEKQEDSLVHDATAVTQKFVKTLLQSGPLRDIDTKYADPHDSSDYELNIKTIHDIPNDISTLTVSGVSKCFKVCGIEKAGEKAKQLGIDGKTIKELNLTVEDMKETFGITALEARQFIRIINGYRPK